ncbi:MAG: EAL domain-containing protein [Hyphomicrobiaceae bacterium]|nr:EAL domain-containing protein [Hyphomicrobiaceae bacterium]
MPATSCSHMPQGPTRRYASPALFMVQAAQGLDMALQPIVSITTGRLLGCEALMRGNEQLDFMSIRETVDFAASLHVLPALDGTLLRKALAKTHPVPTANSPSRGTLASTLVFFNLDARVLPDITQWLAATEAAIAAHGVTPSNICVEITETAGALDSDGFRDGIAALKRAGFRLAIDDFGCGHSGLQLLYETAPDFIKIDRFFVQNLNSDGKKRVFIRSLTDMAHKLGIKVVAEGVESAQEHHFARDMGCDYVQGWFAGRPQLDPLLIEPVASAIAANPDRRGQRRTQSCLSQIAKPYATISPDSSLEDMFSVFEHHPSQSLVPVVDDRGLVTGVVFEADVKAIMYSEFGRDLVRNPSYTGSLAAFTRRMMTVDASTAAAGFLALDFEAIRDGVIVTRDGRYSGYLPPAAIFALTHAHQLDETRNQNPLTGLPGNIPIRDFLSSAEADPSRQRVYAYFDFDNFKPFNDTYGFRQGDRAILLMSDLLKKCLGGSGVFIGHVGGDDFFAGATGDAGRKLAESTPALLDNFAAGVASFYSPDDRTRGSIAGVARDGTPTQFPLMTCSAGVLQCAAGSAPLTVDALSEHLATVKKRAKSAIGGLAHERVG